MIEDRARQVAVVGLGVSGLVTVKNLLERGFDVTGYERNGHIGGLWHYSTDPTQTTVLRSTKTNSSKSFVSRSDTLWSWKLTTLRGCFTDFPFPDDVPHYPSAQQVWEYLEAYADHFSLRPHLHLNTTTIKISPDLEAQSKDPSSGFGWILQLSDEHGVREEYFDRVVVCTGPHQKGWIPPVQGLEDFKGTVMHSQAYKSPDPFIGKRVMVVGLGNTASDIAVELSDSASKVYLSHRSGAWILKRAVDGKPVDHDYSRRLIGMATMLEHYLPLVGQKILGYFLEKDIKKFWGDLDPSWRLLPAPPINNSPPMLSDNLIPALREGRVTSVGGIERFIGPNIVQTADEEVEVDVVIFATGIHYDFSILAPEADPTTFYREAWSKLPHSNGLPYVRLYRNTFSPAYPQSLAFLEACSGPALSAFPGSDLVSQAIAGFWQSETPSTIEIDAWCRKTYDYNVATARHHRLPWIDTSPIEQEEWLNRMAGNRMNEYLGWFSWKSWKWWWSHRELYGLVMDGVMTPFASRLFPQQGRNGRPAWDGAEEHIYRANGKEWRPHKL